MLGKYSFFMLCVNDYKNLSEYGVFGGNLKSELWKKGNTLTSSSYL